MKTLSILALAAALVGTFAISAQAGVITEYSNTWKPGYSLDDSGTTQYSRSVYTSIDTGYNPGSKTVITTETSATAKAGFYLDETGYVRQINVPNPQGTLDRPIEQTQNTWAPGFFLDDNGTYTKM